MKFSVRNTLLLVLFLIASETPTVAAIQLYASKFQSNGDGFVYSDNTFFGTTAGSYASGRFVADTISTVGYVQVQLGGIDDTWINNMSGGWRKAFTLPQTSQVTVKIRFQILMSGEYEKDEYSQALLSIDGKVKGPSNSSVFLGQTIGTSIGYTSYEKPQIIDGYRTVIIDAGTMKAGNHNVTVGAFNNKKTWMNEITQVRFSNIWIDYFPILPTKAPTRAPVRPPTKAPTRAPVRLPTKTPTRAPVRLPTKAPTRTPFRPPTRMPTKRPTQAPVRSPTKSPTKRPTQVPVRLPTKSPTKRPTQAPVRMPTKVPTKRPTLTPIRSPIKTPSQAPARLPTKVPTGAPMRQPTRMPTNAPAHLPTTTPNQPPANSPMLAPVSPSENTQYVRRINVGSTSQFVDSVTGVIWEPDNYFGNKGGLYGQCPMAISGTDNDDIYCKERYFSQWQTPAPFRYDVPVPRSAKYLVQLHFAEIYYTKTQERVFDVWINGQLAVSGLDIIALVGHATALVIPFNTTVSGTTLSVELVAKIENPKICGIEVIEIDTYIPPPTAAPVVQPFQKLINCGGPGFLDNSGSRRWEDDQFFVGGSTYADGSNDVNGTLDDSLYQTERNGEFGYEIPVPVGSYEVILHFAELYWQGTGQRLFNIEIEGVTAATNVDLVALGGGKRLQAFTLESPTIVTDGFVSLAFKNSNPKIDSPKLSGIEINFLSPHLAHSVANGPYIVTDVFNKGSATVQFDGSFSHSHGTGMQIVEWIWKKGSLVLGSGPSPNVTLPVGEHTIYLEVKDNGNNKATDTTTVTVNPYGYPAVLGIEPSVGSISGGQLVTISGSGFVQAASSIKVKFGGTELSGAAVTIVDSFTLQVRAPPAVVGTPVSVSVETPVGSSNSMAYTYQDTSPINFRSDVLTLNIPSVTSVAFGQDGYLYVGTLYGALARLKLDDTYTAVVSSVVAQVAPFRAILGIAFDPMQTSGWSDVYITTSFFFHGGNTSSSGQSINGNIKKVSGANLDAITDIVTGLPVADHDHGLTGLEFGDHGEIYIQCASNTNAGIPGRLTGKQVQKDNYYSSATVMANLADPLFDGAITYDKEDDGIPNGGHGIEVFAAGTRNPFGICLHSNGNIYATDNGPNYGYGDMMTGCEPGQSIPDRTEGDKINLLKKGGYYGAPNRIRALTSNDTRQCVWRSQNEPSSNGYTAPILRPASSTDGLIEYHADHFDKQLRYNLIAAKYQGSLYRVILSQDGNSVIPQSDPAIVLTPDVDALDVTQAPDGTLISSSLDRNAIYFHKPIETATTVLQVKSVFPRRGSVLGGNKLDIFGLNFNATVAVLVGGRSCPVTLSTSSKLQCTLPGQGTIGTVDITVTGGDGQTYTFERGYRYITGLPQ